MCEYNTKSSRRDSKRKNKEKKWIKHNYGENWWKPHGNNISKWLKKRILGKSK